MKNNLLIILPLFFIFATSSIDLVYGLNENNSKIPNTVTITNETKTLKESPIITYEKRCPENTDWPEAPNHCDRQTNYTRTELKDLYAGYYQYKGAEWMEMKKAEMDSVILSGSWNEWMREYPALWMWLGHAQREIPSDNINVYLYYFLNGQAPDVGWGWYSVNDEFEPIITLYYISPGAIMIISSVITIGAANGVFLSFKKILLHPKRKRLASIGFALVFVGASMYSVGLFGFIQSQINQMDEQVFLPEILYVMFIFFGIPISLAGIPVILHGFIQRFSIIMTLLTSLGVIIAWTMFIISRFD